jgi:phosphoheptose isomerase
MSSAYDLRTFAPTADDGPVKFPSEPYANAAPYLDAYAEELSRAAKSIEPAAFAGAAAILAETYLRGARVFSCGNGGSASIANHMQCDHVKGIRTATDLSPHVLSLSNNVELLTAIANDTCYENIFVYQLQSQSEPGDVLLAVSSSGRSPNIIRALTWARDRASTEAPPGPWPRSASMLTARTTASSRTCTRPSCMPWPSTSASRE